MKPSKAIKYKALILLISFSLNSVVGFACSLGVDMGFNGGHHAHSRGEKHAHSSTEHTGVHGSHHHNKHDHNGKPTHKHKHNYAKEHQHSSIKNHGFKETDDDNCCTDFVIGFQNLEKTLPQKTPTDTAKNFFLPFALPNKVEWQAVIYVEPIRIPPKIPDHSPPDIRVFIQSFQI